MCSFDGGVGMALVFGDEVMTYGELRRRTLVLGAYLQAFVLLYFSRLLIVSYSLSDFFCGGGF